MHLVTLKSVFGIKWKRVPTASALRKIIVRQDPAEIEKTFRLFSMSCHKSVSESGGMKQICTDGKTLNASFSHAKDQRASRIFSAFSCVDELVLAHIPLSSDKEITLNIMRNNKNQNIRQKIYENTLNLKKMIDTYFINDCIF